MSINLNLKHLSIVKQSDNYYKLCFLKKNELFLQSIVVPMLLDGAFMNDSFNTIEFYAHSVKPLSLYLQSEMPYNSVIHLLWYLSKQHDFLKKHSYGFYCLHLNDTHLVYSKIIDILSPISDSKLYWCLLKCLCVDSNKRSLLFV